MKAITTLLLLLMLGNNAYSASKHDSEWANKKSKTPPGTIMVSPNFYADRCEISNINWLEYLYWLRQNNPKKTTLYTNALPDTTVWKNEAYQNNYLRSVTYQNYPVVGVSYEQVIAYCKWRSDRVNEMLLIKDNKKADLANSVIPQKVTYRLPTETEWMQIATLSLNTKKGKQQLEATFNVKKEKNNDLKATKAVQTKNKISYHHIIGNVAEMTAQKGVAKGGSWQHTLIESDITKVQKYENVSAWLGFRCVCVVNE